jgi:ATP-dependent protease Clp ATPase subunit
MYHLPSQRKVREILVTKEMVEKREISIQYFEKAG